MVPITRYVEAYGMGRAPTHGLPSHRILWFDRTKLTVAEAERLSAGGLGGGVEGEHWGWIDRGHTWTPRTSLDSLPPHVEWVCACGETHWTHGEPPPA
jgi:hypothetical protein